MSATPGNGAGAATEQPLSGETVKQFLSRSSVRASIARVITGGLDPDRLIAIAAMACYRNPDIMRCDMVSIAAAVTEAAELGLEPGNSTLAFGYLVPRPEGKTGLWKCSFQTSWKGKMELARRSGLVARIEAHEISRGDFFQFQLGTDAFLHHRWDPFGARRGEIVGYYAVAYFKDGGCQFEIMSAAEIRTHGDKYSKAAEGKAWRDSFDGMAKKTVLHRLENFLPLSPLQQKAHEADADIPTTFEVDPVEEVDHLPAAPAGGVADPGPDDAGAPVAKPAPTADSMSQKGPVDPPAPPSGPKRSRALAAAQKNALDTLPGVATGPVVAPAKETVPSRPGPSSISHEAAQPTSSGTSEDGPGPCGKTTENDEGVWGCARRAGHPGDHSMYLQEPARKKPEEPGAGG